MKLVVYFEAAAVDDYHDIVTITSEEGFKYLLKISALKPQPFINYPEFLDLGYSQINKSKEGKILFTNHGKEAGRITLKNDKLKIDPSIINVFPGQSVEVTIEYWTNVASVFR